MTDTPGGAPQPQSLNLSMQPGPDGSMWVGLHFQYGPLMAVMVVPPDFADMTADQLPAALRDVARQARAASGKGIITAPANALDVLRNHRKGAS